MFAKFDQMKHVYLLLPLLLNLGYFQGFKRNQFIDRTSCLEFEYLIC